MKRFEFRHPLFITSATEPKGYPPKGLPEIALVGRSNVGKSSLLNHLFQSKGLVKTSSRPGKTQLLNFFTLGNSLSFVDLPGYGFAHANTKGWAEMIECYLDTRKPLILLLLDIRHLPSAQDMQMVSWLKSRECETILVLTKTDQVSRSARGQKSAEILRQLGVTWPLVHYSALKNEGRKELIHQITTCLS